MDGLIIKPHWLNKIISGEKTLEIRGSGTSKVGTEIYLIESGGKARATAVIKDCIRLDRNLWIAYKDLHCVGLSWEELTERYKQPYAWVLDNVRKIEPFEYRKHQGAVIWVKNVE